MRYWFLLLIVLVGCDEAMAARARDRVRSRGIGGGEGGAAAEGSAIYTNGQVWDAVWDTRDCVDSPGLTTWTSNPQSVTSVALTQGSSGGYTCGVSTSGLSSTGIGSALVDKAMRFSSTASGCWSIADSTIGILENNKNYLIRVLMRIRTAGIPSGYTLLTFRRDGNNFFNSGASTSEQLSNNTPISGTSYVRTYTTTTLSGETWYLVDMVYNGDPGQTGSSNPQYTTYINGVLQTATDRGANAGGFGTSGANSLTISGAVGCGSSYMVSTDIVMIGLAINDNATWWSPTKHATDCTASGACP